MTKQLYVFCDGGARGNPGPAAIGFLIKDDKRKVLVRKGEYIGGATNNVAEYKAVICSLNWLIKNKQNLKPQILHLKFFIDSQLIVNQLMGRYKIKQPHLQQLAIKVKELESQLQNKVVYQHIPREKNTEADELLNRALDNSLKPTS